MQIRTDDDVYRVDAVWLGPPRATFPWRARYASYGVGLIVMIVVMFFQRRLGIPLGFFSVAWALLITVVVVRFVSKRIDEDRPLLEWLTLFVHELRGPRRRTRGAGSTVGTGHVAIEAARPRRALPAGRTDPHAALAVSPRRGAGRRDRDDEAAPPRRRRGGRRSWTTRGGRGPASPFSPTTAATSTRTDPTDTTAASDDEAVLHVTARRADRPAASWQRRPRSRPATGARRFGPSARRAPDDDASRSNADRHDADRHDADRHDADRHDADRHDADRHDADRHDEEGDGAAPARS